MKPKSSLSLLCALVLGMTVASHAESGATITIQADQTGHPVSPTLWGIFFEDINLSADGRGNLPDHRLLHHLP